MVRKDSREEQQRVSWNLWASWTSNSTFIPILLLKLNVLWKRFPPYFKTVVMLQWSLSIAPLIHQFTSLSFMADVCMSGLCMHLQNYRNISDYVQILVANYRAQDSQGDWVESFFFFSPLLFWWWHLRQFSWNVAVFGVSVCLLKLTWSHFPCALMKWVILSHFCNCWYFYIFPVNDVCRGRNVMWGLESVKCRNCAAIQWRFWKFLRTWDSTAPLTTGHPASKGL